MRNLLALGGALGALLAPATVLAQFTNEVIGAAVIQVPGDPFGCGRGDAPCNLRHRVYNELDPTDFFGVANPTDGYPRYFRAGSRYSSDPQLSSNYPSSTGGIDLQWYSVWDGVMNPDSFTHGGYYGAQSQVISHGEIGNPLSTNCLPIVGQNACFAALSAGTGNDLWNFGPSGGVDRQGGLSPIPRPTVMSVDGGGVELSWEEAASWSSRDGASTPLLGYRVFLARRPLEDRFGPTQTDLLAAETSGDLIDLTPGTWLPLATTSLSLSSSDPLLTPYNPATESLVAVIKMVYAHDIESLYFSGHSFPFTFDDPTAWIGGFQARVSNRWVVLSWQAERLAGIQGFSVTSSTRAQGPYYPIDRQEVEVGGTRGNFSAVDRLSLRRPARQGTDTLYYRLEIIGLDGSRTMLDPLAVDISATRRGNGTR